MARSHGVKLTVSCVRPGIKVQFLRVFQEGQSRGGPLLGSYSSSCCAVGLALGSVSECKEGSVPVDKYTSPVPAVSNASTALAVYAVSCAPVVEKVSPAPAVKHAVPAPAVSAAPLLVVEYTSPAPAMSYAVPAPVVEYISPAPAVSAAPAPMVKSHLSGASGEPRLTCSAAARSASAPRCTHEDCDRNRFEQGLHF